MSEPAPQKRQQQPTSSKHSSSRFMRLLQYSDRQDIHRESYIILIKSSLNNLDITQKDFSERVGISSVRLNNTLSSAQQEIPSPNLAKRIINNLNIAIHIRQEIEFHIEQARNYRRLSKKHQHDIFNQTTPSELFTYIDQTYSQVVSELDTTATTKPRLHQIAEFCQTWIQQYAEIAPPNLVGQITMTLANACMILDKNETTVFWVNYVIALLQSETDQSLSKQIDQGLFWAFLAKSHTCKELKLPEISIDILEQLNNLPLALPKNNQRHLYMGRVIPHHIGVYAASSKRIGMKQIKTLAEEGYKCGSSYLHIAINLSRIFHKTERYQEERNILEPEIRKMNQYGLLEQIRLMRGNARLLILGNENEEAILTLEQAHKKALQNGFTHQAKEIASDTKKLIEKFTRN